MATRRSRSAVRLQRSASTVAAPSLIFKRLLSFRRSKSITSVDNNNKVNNINNNNNFDNNNVQIIKSISDLNEVLKQGNFDRGKNLMGTLKGTVVYFDHLSGAVHTGSWLKYFRSAVFNLFVHFKPFSVFSPKKLKMNKKKQKRLKTAEKKYFDQLMGACSTRKLV